VIYFATPSTSQIREVARAGWCGLIVQPNSGYRPAFVLDAVVPDVVGDHEATLAQWDTYADVVTGFGYRPAFVLQDGCTPDEIPEDAYAVFVGGSDRFKLSAEARVCVDSARDLAMWTHMGRVNSRHRLLLAASWGIDSVDGTYAAFGPDINFPRILAWVEEANNREALCLS
jgi:hypothetical protein